MATRQVGAGQTHKTIQSAINAAADGDTIIVHAGSYFEALSVSKRNITIKANAGDRPEITGKVDTGGSFSGYQPSAAKPTAGAWKNRSGPRDYKHSDRGSLINVSKDGFTIEGVDITRSTGRAITFNHCHNHLVKNCKISKCRGSAVINYHSNNVTLDNVEITECVNFYFDATWVAHPGCVGFRGASNGKIINGCFFHNNGGELVMMDNNNGGSQGLVIQDSIFGDAREMLLYIHDTQNVTVERNVYYTSDYRLKNSMGGGFYAGIVCKGVEKQYYEGGKSPHFGHVKNVIIRNNLFINNKSNVIFGGPSISNPIVDNMQLYGNTFINTKGGKNLNHSGAKVRYTNISIKGNAFYTTGGSGDIFAGSANGFNFANNYANKTMPSVMNHAQNVVDANIGLNAINANIPLSGVNVDNYKISSGASKLVGKYVNPVAKVDRWNNNRVNPSSLGFHDFNATGSSGGTQVPRVSFTASPSVGEAKKPITLSDTSTPSTGNTITTRAWTVHLLGTSVDFTGANPSLTFTPPQDGTYQVNLVVSDSGGGSANSSMNIHVNPVPGTQPDPPLQDPDVPVSGNFGAWVSAVRSGKTSPQFQTLASGERFMKTTKSSQQGMWFSWYTGTVTPGDKLTIKYRHKGSVSSGNITMMLLYYKGNSLLSTPSSKPVPNSATYSDDSLDVTVPATADRIRIDFRSWGAVGEITFRDVVLEHTVAAPGRVEAKLEATSGGKAVVSGSSLPKSTTVQFDASKSTGTGLTYEWRVFKSDNSLLDAPETTATISKTFIENDSYTVQLVVKGTGSHAPVDSTFFYLVIVDTQDGTISVDFTVDPAVGFGSFMSQLIPHLIDGADLKAVYTWQIIDDAPAHAILEEYYSDSRVDDGIVEVKFPLDGSSKRDDYGIRLIADVEGLGSHVTATKYRVIRISPAQTNEGTPIIGPAKPLTIGLHTDNVVLEGGGHSHRMELTDAGAANRAVATDRHGVTYLTHLLLSQYEEDRRHSDMSKNVRLQIDGGDLYFSDGGKIVGPVITLDSQEIVFTNLPQTKPSQSGRLWLDGDTLKVS